MTHQVDVVRSALGPAYSEVPVRPVLCFVGAVWPRFRRRPLSIRGTTVVWPDGLPAILEPDIGAPCYDVGAMAATIGSGLRPA